MSTSSAGNDHGEHSESCSKLVSACCSALKERIAKVAPTANRCMIENSDEPVDYVHLIPPTGIPSAIDYLEYAWDKKPGTLNLHTRYNSILLGSKLRDCFNEGKWLLLPEPHIIELYLDGRCNPMSVPPTISEPYYRYTILPLDDMALLPITRHTTDDTGVAIAQTHTFPYQDLGLIPSHLHPHYAIFHAARTIMKFHVYRKQYPTLDYEAIFGDIIVCYASWTIRIANLKMQAKFPADRRPYSESDSDSDSHISETTPPSTPRHREPAFPRSSSLGQRKKVSIEEWRNSVVVINSEGGDRIRGVQDATEGEVVDPSSP